VTATPSVTAPRAAAQQQIAAVRVPAQSLRGELRAIKIVWQREMIRFTKDRLRIVTSLVQPFLFLFVLGTGLSRLASAGTHGVNLRTFVYPGVLCMAVMFIAVFSAASIVWDREFGFLREMMVAPVRRSSLVLGKCFGGATVAAFEGLILIALAGLVGGPLRAGPAARDVRPRAPARVLDHGVRRDGGRARAPDAVVHGPDADDHHADVLRLGARCFPCQAYLPGLRSSTGSTPLTYAVDPDAPRGLRPPAHQQPRPPRA
jgi:hypothetical protein